MASDATVRRVVSRLQANFGRRTVPDATIELWNDQFRDDFDRALENAMEAFINNPDDKLRFPTVGQFREYVNIELRRLDIAAGTSGCGDCSDGLRYQSRNAHGGPLGGAGNKLEPCDCPRGRAKARYLNREHREGRAWLPERRDSNAS